MTGRAARAIVFASVLAAAACGVRTNVRPPEDTMPAAPSAFKASLVDNEVRLAWNRPEKSADGDKLHDLTGFIIERGAGGGPFAVVDRINVTDRDSIRPQRKYKWRDLAPVDGNSRYRVRAYTQDGQEGLPSAIETLRVSEAVVKRAAEIRSSRQAAE